MMIPALGITWPNEVSGWAQGSMMNVMGSYMVWAMKEIEREKLELTPFNNVVLVTDKTRRPVKLTQRKEVRVRKIWNKRRRTTRLKVSRRKRHGAEYLRTHVAEAKNLQDWAAVA